MTFDYAKITKSRLMGSMGLIIRYEENKEYIYQYFLLDGEGLGIADYISLKNPTSKEACREGISYSEIYTYNEGSDLENFKEAEDELLEALKYELDHWNE